MKGAKIILVPVDFQEASHEALALAKELAVPLGLEVVLLHLYAIPVSVYPGFDPILAPNLPQEIETNATEAVQRLAAQHGGLRSYVRSGDPATEVLEAIRELDPQLVVMGTHGREGLSHLLLGSVTEKVVRNSTAPVLTLRVGEK